MMVPTLINYLAGAGLRGHRWLPISIRINKDFALAVGLNH
jgi:hypothetical protein